MIFQYAPIGKAPKKKRGKIARIVSSKIAIAAKADAFTKNFIAGKLKQEMDEKIITIDIKKPDLSEVFESLYKKEERNAKHT